MLKVAAIDVGSNAIRMTVAELDDLWKVKVIENIRVPVRLGQDVFTKGILDETSMKQTVDAFLRFQRLAKDLGVYRLRAVATSAMREAGNGHLLADRIYRATEIKVEVIDGDEEARLIHQAAMNALDIKNKHALLIDIGGGSVEVTLTAGRNIIFAHSYNIGTVRLLKKLETKGRSKLTFSQLVHESTESARRRIGLEIGKEKISICAATGGSIEEIGRLRIKMFKVESDRLITLVELEGLIERLGKMTIEDRILKLKLRPDRADVILPAAIVLHLIASEAHVKQIAIPNIGLKDGILLDIAQELSRAPLPERKEQVLESALYLGRKYQFDEEHAILTMKLASQLFLQSVALHNLDKSNLLFLEAAAFLHDIGHFINTIDHDKHGFYLLKTNHLIGLSKNEQDIVASLVRYHRSKMPSLEDDGFKSMSAKDRLTVLKLSALLRLADSMDLNHTGRIPKVTLKEGRNGWVLKLSSDLIMEKWTIEKRKALFQSVFGENLIIE